jgi:hypothetical protein
LHFLPYGPCQGIVGRVDPGCAARFGRLTAASRSLRMACLIARNSRSCEVDCGCSRRTVYLEKPRQRVSAFTVGKLRVRAAEPLVPCYGGEIPPFPPRPSVRDVLASRFGAYTVCLGRRGIGAAVNDRCFFALRIEMFTLERVTHVAQRKPAGVVLRKPNNFSFAPPHSTR